MGRKQHYHPNRLDHGYADLSGSRHTGKPNFSQCDDADEQPDPLNGFLENFVWTLSPADFLSLWIHHVEGASAADLARQLDKHRGTVGRRLDRLAEEAKAGALAALAALMIGKGADRFLLCPRSGKRLASLDQEGVSFTSLAAHFDHAPSVEEIHAFLVGGKQELLEEDACLGAWSGPHPEEWRLVVCKRLSPTDNQAG